ncbi:hypothetical protein SAMN03159448_06872 [Sinorhizobium sp. NFACC03]|nr:hypothetical protein SAMN03159448_06872 [Sinorhizobium sp. NFACC03]
MAFFPEYPYGRCNTLSVKEGIPGVFRNGTEHNLTIGQCSRIGEAKWNPVDRTKINPVD